MKKMAKNSLDLNNIQIIYEGVLKKSPPIKSKSLFNMIAKFSCATERSSSNIFHKRWRKRYFVLFKSINKPDDIHLLYFKSKPTPDSRSLGSINMDNFGSLSVDAGKKMGKSNVFSIQTTDEKGNDRVYYLSADSFDMMNLWVDNIVNCLDLNQKSSKTPYASPAIQSPLIQSMKNTNRNFPNRPLTPGSNQLPGRSSKPLIDMSRSSVNSHQTDIPTVYYNMDSMFPTHEPIEDSIFTEEDDIYKIPCDGNQLHSYFNLGDESQTPIPKQSNNISQMFFGNDNSFSDFRTNTKHMNMSSDNVYKNLKSNDSVLHKTNNSANQYLSENFIDLKDDLEHDFNFELPSRITNDDSSSTSSCYSSTYTNSSTKEFETNNETISFKDVKGLCPPQVPKRLNILENPIVLPPRNQSFDTPLPTKPPKAMKSDNFSNGHLDENSMVLNYLDATTLILENKNNCGLNNYSNPNDPVTLSFIESPTISPDRKNLGDVSPTHDILFHHNIELFRDSVSSNLSTIGQNLKDFPLVEYSEINDARTEGLHKLNERILKNE